ncbi:MAG: PGF-pre-PGF domain-containing protein, partial [Candidatus Nanohaloarchaea archaeon]
GGGGSGSGSGGNNQQSSGGNGEQQQQEPEAINRSVIVGRGNSETLDIGAETVGKLKVSAVDDHDLIGSIEYREFDNRPSSVESPPRGQTYRWLEVERNNIDNRNVRSAVFHFKVSKGWLSDNSIAPETVKLLRYNEGWLELDTSVRSEDAGNVYYRATSPGFSYFTITGRTYQSLFEVRQLSVDRKRLMAGGNVSINVTVYNGAQESASYTVEVDAGGKTLSREVTVEGRSNRTVSFLRTFESGGTKKISAGGRSVEVVVETEGLPWMMIGGGLLGIIGLFAVYVFWPRITGEIHTLEMSVEGVIEDLEKTAVGLASKAGVLHEVVRGVGGSGRDYSFEGFGDDEDFDYSFDKA